MRVESLIELLSWKPPTMRQIIGEGILYPETKMILYGEWGTWKSMIAMHMAFCMSEGVPWLTHSTTPTKTLMIQTEIPKALYRERVLKYVSNHVVQRQENIDFVTELGLKLDSPFGVANLEEAMKKSKPKVCIIDPVYKAMGGDISSSVDVQKTIDNIDLIMNRYNCACILVAHENKGQIDLQTGQKYNRGAGKIMGSSYWPDWADSIACLSATGPCSVELCWEKYRNAQDIINDEEVQIDRKTLRIKAAKIIREE